MEKNIFDLSCLVYSEYVLFLMRSSTTAISDYSKTELFIREDPRRIYLLMVRSSKNILTSFFRLKCHSCNRVYVFPYAMFFKCKTCLYKNFIFCEECSHSPKMEKHLTHHIIYTTLHRIACLFYNFEDVYDIQKLGETLNLI